MASESKSATSAHDSSEPADYKHKYKSLKHKLKGLVYEHELLSEQLEKAQKKLLKVSKDRSFLLDRISLYEKVADSSSDSDATDLSDSDVEKPPKKKMATPLLTPLVHSMYSEDSQDAVKKTPKAKPSNKKLKPARKSPPLTIEDIERHLDSRPSVPSIEKATSSMPADIFSNVDSDGSSDNEVDTGLIIDANN